MYVILNYHIFLNGVIVVVVGVVVGEIATPSVTVTVDGTVTVSVGVDGGVTIASPEMSRFNSLDDLINAPRVQRKS